MSSTKVMSIKCKKCNQKVFKYLKVGKGNLLKAYKSKIQTEYFEIINGEMFCKCGHKLGIDQGSHFKMLDHYKYD